MPGHFRHVDQLRRRSYGSDDAAGERIADHQGPSPRRNPMSVQQHRATTPNPTNAADTALIEQLYALSVASGNRFLPAPAPDNELPMHGMRSAEAMRLIGE